MGKPHVWVSTSVKEPWNCWNVGVAAKAKGAFTPTRPTAARPATTAARRSTPMVTDPLLAADGASLPDHGSRWARSGWHQTSRSLLLPGRKAVANRSDRRWEAITSPCGVLLAGSSARVL